MAPCPVLSGKQSPWPTLPGVGANAPHRRRVWYLRQIPPARRIQALPQRSLTLLWFLENRLNAALAVGITRNKLLSPIVAKCLSQPHPFPRARPIDALL